MLLWIAIYVGCGLILLLLALRRLSQSQPGRPPEIIFVESSGRITEIVVRDDKELDRIMALVAGAIDTDE